MAITNTTQFIDLRALSGTGEVGRYLPEVTGILVGIEPREGWYKVTDRDGKPVIDQTTGRQMVRPNSWTAHFRDGSMWSWPTYVDEATGQVMPWSRFDPTIDLAACAEQGIAIHCWKDDRNFSHLEIAEEQVGNLNPLPIMPTAPVAQAQPPVAQPPVAQGINGIGAPGPRFNQAPAVIPW